MPCFYPVRAFRAAYMAGGRPTGKYYISFTEPAGEIVQSLYLPCGSCDGCRIERSRQWAIRCMHEAQMHEENCVITLTYNEDHIPDRESLQYEDFQKFMKRVRKNLKGKKVRYFVCGEYGELGGRPHYHACIFGHRPNDLVYHKTSKSGSRLYESKWLQNLWADKDGNPIGFALVGDLDFSSASYIARYVMKKANGRDLGDRTFVDLETGEESLIEPEFVRMSLKNGIGQTFYEKYFKDMFPRDYVVINGRQMKPPRYYTKLLAKHSEMLYAQVQDSRLDGQIKGAADNTQDRLEVKEKVLKARLAFLKRN